MSFSARTKNELARVFPQRLCCQKAELAALVRMDGCLQKDRELQLGKVILENAAVARKVYKLFKSLYGVEPRIAVKKRSRLRKNNLYVVSVEKPDLQFVIMHDLGLIDKNSRYIPRVKNSLVRNKCCGKSFLRGVFLGGGSVNSPEGTYHLEIITSAPEFAEDISALLQRFSLGAKISTRKNWFVVYLKESDQIVNFLNIVGAHSALLDFENVRVYKDVRNQVNRLVNCETANLSKTVNAAMRQIENIKLIDQTVGLHKLPPSLKEVAEMRLSYPDTSLKELGEMLSPKVSKSGINHRMRRLEEIAEKLSKP